MTTSTADAIDACDTMSESSKASLALIMIGDLDSECRYGWDAGILTRRIERLNSKNLRAADSEIPDPVHPDLIITVRNSPRR